MKREIKFRAWTGKEMITPPNECIGVGSGAELIEISLAGVISKRNAYGLDGFNVNPTFDEPERGIVLMQFAGLQDKNGIDIYEGDILREWLEDSTLEEAGFWWHGVITFFNGQWKVLQHDFNYTGWIDMHKLYEDFDDLDVVGNIYENPELIIS